MAKVKKKSVKELNAEFELLEERVMKLEVIIASQVLTASVDPGKVQEKLNGIEEALKSYDKKLEEKTASEDQGKVQEKLNGIEEALKSYDKKIGDLDRELLQARQDNNIEKGKDSKKINGDICDKIVKVKPNLKEHTRSMHPKTYECEICDETFMESWKMEEHLEHHGNERPFKCSICNKGFYMKWRMEKHTSDHRADVKFCHYFNNGKPCPYEKVGCKFKHETAPECRFNLKCTFKLCQFTHTTKMGEEPVPRLEVEAPKEAVPRLEVEKLKEAVARLKVEKPKKGAVATRGNLLPAMISTDRRIAISEIMILSIKELNELNKVNEENDSEESYDDSEDDSEDSDASDDEEKMDWTLD